jgi:hypothetical protein
LESGLSDREKIAKSLEKDKAMDSTFT